MIKFDKLSSEEISSIIKKIIVTVILAAVTVGVATLSSWVGSNCDDLRKMDKQLNDIYQEKQMLIASIEDKTAALSDIKLDDSVAPFSKEELVVMLGDCARESGVSIIGLDSANAEIEDSITKYNFVFEIKGTTSQIAKTLAGIDAHKLHYAINEMSLRQEGDYLWLQRNFDEQITWWDLSNITTAGGFQSRVNITADDIINDDIMTLYLDLNFIFVNSKDIDPTEGLETKESAVIAEG